MPHVRHMCCSEHGVFVEMTDGSMWWRRHEWLADRWAPVGRPGLGHGVTSGETKPRTPRRRR
jgi:hypothetical protein